MNKGARLTALLFCAARLWAQPLIEGSVVDEATGIPIGGATVSLQYSMSPLPISNTATGAGGTFRFVLRGPGYYVTEASAPGYLKDRSVLFPVTDGDFAPGAPSVPRSVVLKLARSSAVSGHIRDADTGQPLKLISVRAYRTSWFWGRRRLNEEAAGVTDEKGNFRVEALPPGDYILEIRNRAPANSGPGKKYPVIFLPSATADSLDTLKVGPGAEAGMGNIEYSRLQLPRIDLSIKGDCAEKYPGYQLLIDRRVGGAYLHSDVVDGVCGKSLPITVSPGTYEFSVDMGLGPDARFGSAEATVSDSGKAEVEVVALPFPKLSGRVRCECDHPEKIEFAPLRVQLRAEHNGVFGGTGFNLMPDGTFSLPPGPIQGRTNISVGGLPKSVAGRRVLVNGTEFPLAIYPGQISNLEIILTDRPAAIAGTAPGEQVVLARWPLPRDYFPEDVRIIPAKDGAFTFADLTPGEYRIASLTAAQWARFHEPGLLTQWLELGEKLQLEPGEQRTVTLKKTE
jgi:hypothetical protein